MIADVIPLIRLPRQFTTFSYEVPKNLEAELRVGQCVCIPFRKRSIFGLVVDIKKNHQENLKSIENIINAIPLIGADYLGHLKKLSEFYGVSSSAAAKLALPTIQPKKIGGLLIEPWFDKKKTAAKPAYTWYADAREHKKAYAVFNEPIAIIVPEVHHIKYILDQLPEDRKKSALIWTSDTSVKDQREIWFAIRNHQAGTLIATRSALWLPLHQSFDRIIIDFEHAQNHKHWDQSPRYCTKDLGKLLSRHFGVNYTEMSFSPSVSSFYFIQKKQYEAAQRDVVPTDSLVILHASPGDRAEGILFPQTINYVKESCADNKDSIILYNRRDKETSEFPSITTIAQHIKKEIDDVEIITVTSDTPLATAQTSRPRILIGTQALLSAVDWSRVCTVVMADFDEQLLFPEYQAREAVWHTIREILFFKPKDALFIIQTKQPEHPLLLSLSRPTDWYAQELAAREELGYPPFSYLVRYLVGAKTLTHSGQEAEKLAKIIQNQLTCEPKKIILQGPLPAEPVAFRGAYWHILMLKIMEPDILAATRWVNTLLPASTSIKIDPHPISLLHPS